MSEELRDHRSGDKCPETWLRMSFTGLQPLGPCPVGQPSAALHDRLAGRANPPWPCPAAARTPGAAPAQHNKCLPGDNEGPVPSLHMDEESKNGFSMGRKQKGCVCSAAEGWDRPSCCLPWLEALGTLGPSPASKQETWASKLGTWHSPLVIKVFLATRWT